MVFIDSHLLQKKYLSKPEQQILIKLRKLALHTGTGEGILCLVRDSSAICSNAFLSALPFLVFVLDFCLLEEQALYSVWWNRGPKSCA